MEHQSNSYKHPFFDLTIGVKEIILIIGFIATVGGAWYTVKSDARSTRELVDSRYEQYQKDQQESINIRAALISQIKENNDNVRQDIRELRSIVLSKQSRQYQSELYQDTPKPVLHGRLSDPDLTKDRR